MSSYKHEPDQNTIQSEVDVHQKHNLKTEQDSLEVMSVAVSQYEHTNKKGRPRKGNVIHFGPQPQSMISKLLSKVKADCIIGLPAEQHDYHNVTLYIPSTPICNSEPDQTEDELYSKKAKRRKKNKKANDTTKSKIYLKQGQNEEDDYHKKPKRRKKIKKAKDTTKPKTHSCDFENCSYSTKLASNMIKHKRVHTGEKPYLCDRCSFRSNFINSLKCHKRLHSDVRPYKCSECGYSCNSISNLKKHSHTRHKTTNC